MRIIEAAEHSLEFNASPVSLATDENDRRSGGDRRRSIGGMPAIAWSLSSGAS